jgi:hypothetical protein
MTPLLCIWETLALNLAQLPKLLTERFHDFALVFPGKCWESTSNQTTIASIFFLIHHPFVICYLILKSEQLKMV